MKKAPLFSHRPPTTGVHLLSDPFPAHLLPPPYFVSDETNRVANAKGFLKQAKSRKGH